MKEKIEALKAAFPYTLPILFGFLFLGITYGILMRSRGYGAGWSLLMSLVGYCGSMQFVAVGLMITGSNPLHIFLLSAMVNARHIFYGISMLEKYRGIGRIKPFLIATLCDETFSIVYSTKAPDGIEQKWFYFFISLLDYIYWALSCFLGGLIGGFIHFQVKGLDFALTALFLVIFTEQWQRREHRPATIVGLICSGLCLLCMGQENFIVPAMFSILTVLTLLKKRLGDGVVICN